MWETKIEGQRRKWKLRAVLAGVFIVGGVIVGLAHFWPWETLREITKEIGVAFMVAAILGVTIDEASKNELIRD
jgi:hypothetical protein